MFHSVFVITLGDVIGLSLVALMIVGAIIYVAFMTIRESFCRHDFKPAKINKSGSFYMDGYRCTKCKTERNRLPEVGGKNV